MIKYNKQRGFTLIEILFASAIMAVALLGYSILQFHNTKSSRNALDRIWAQEQVRQLIENMMSNPQAMENRASFSNNAFFTGPIGTSGSTYSGYNTETVAPVSDCYIRGNSSVYEFNRSKVNFYGNVYARDPNSTKGGYSCDDNLTTATDYLYNMTLSDAERYLGKANMKVTCNDHDTSDAYNCSPGGSRVDVYLSWSRDPAVTDLSEVVGCPRTTTTTGGSSYAIDFERGFSGNNIDSGIQCAVYTFFY